MSEVETTCYYCYHCYYYDCYDYYDYYCYHCEIQVKEVETTCTLLASIRSSCNEDTCPQAVQSSRIESSRVEKSKDTAPRILARRQRGPNARERQLTYALGPVRYGVRHAVQGRAQGRRRRSRRC